MDTTDLTTDALLRATVIEQVMRSTGDETLLWPFLDAERGSRSAHIALGRLLATSPVRLVAGCPLLAWLAGTGLDPGWRNFCPTAVASMWSTLTFYQQLYGPGSGTDPYVTLCELTRLDDAAFDGVSDAA